MAKYKIKGAAYVTKEKVRTFTITANTEDQACEQFMGYMYDLYPDNCEIDIEEVKEIK